MERSGFFNALKTDAGYDRKYTANDYNENLAAIISNGVRRSGDNELRVTAAGGMALNVAIGRAWIDGHWYINDTNYTNFVVPTAPTGDRSRIDRVVLRLDNSTAGRTIKLYYLTGVVDSSPKAPELTRNSSIYELALADIFVGANVLEITQGDIIDHRADKDLCGWITSPIGYDEYFANLDAEFKEWFNEKKDTLSSTTLFKQYRWSKTVDTQTNTITFDIPQYDPTGVDILNVFVNGTQEFVNRDFTIDNNTITFNTIKIAGTEIDVIVYKSIDGSGLGSVSDEVTKLQNAVSLIKNIGNYIYLCNGVNDNVKLSELAQTFLSGSDLNQMVISVYGTFGVSAPYAGNGSSVSRYRWMSLGTGANTTRKIIFDFEGCSEIRFNGDPSYHYIGIYGANVHIKNATFIASNNSSFQMFSATNTNIVVENCRFYLQGSSNTFVAQTGNFINCFAECLNQDDSYCFKVASNGLLRLNAGEYYSYSTSGIGYVIYGLINSVTIANNVNAPTVAKSGYTQKSFYSFDVGAKAVLNSNITTLTVNTSSSSGVIANNTISLSLPNRG